MRLGLAHRSALPVAHSQSTPENTAVSLKSFMNADAGQLWRLWAIPMEFSSSMRPGSSGHGQCGAETIKQTPPSHTENPEIRNCSTTACLPKVGADFGTKDTLKQTTKAFR